MTLSEEVQKYFQTHYVSPARERGQSQIEVKAGDVHSGLGWSRRVPLVCAALSSQKIQHRLGLRLTEKQGPPSGQSPTVVFHFEILNRPDAKDRLTNVVSVIDLSDLYGIGAKAYRDLGGGEEYLRREREALQFPAEAAPRTKDRA
jgi:hypothetical protein